jgi:hypothetical protein
MFVKVSVIASNTQSVSLTLAAPTCNDGIKNGNEGGIDCGGWCLPTQPCGDGSTCNNGSDCASSVCKLNVCQGKCIFF